MYSAIRLGLRRLKTALSATFVGPQALAFTPALTLGAYWLGGETFLLATAFAIPGLMALTGLLSPTYSLPGTATDHATGLPLRAAAVTMIDALLAENATRGRTTGCIAACIDEFDELEERAGQRGRDLVLTQVAHRLQGALRDTDLVVRLGGPAFGIVLASVRRADLEAMLQLSARLQAAVSEPISLDGTRIYVSVSLGFCTPDKSPAASGEAFLEAAEQALQDAQSHGTGSIRAYSPEIRSRARVRNALADEIADALNNDQIRPWFQPQVRVDTGAVSGVEALARWDHPERGLISPAEFLPVVAAAGLSEHLGERILFHSLQALSNWDNEGFVVPKVSVNFSTDELRNPGLVDKLRWELDRFDIAPHRLTVEVLETVIASTRNDTIVRNLWSLSELGCGIDLDDFGTGHAAIGNIRRFAVARVKIDRSFVTRLDLDQDQQNVVAAILLMADRLNLGTLAEGVETPGERAVLERLGCDHIQGYGIARPMPETALLSWLRSYSGGVAPSGGRPGATAASGGLSAPQNAGKTA